MVKVTVGHITIPGPRVYRGRVLAGLTTASIGVSRMSGDSPTGDSVLSCRHAGLAVIRPVDGADGNDRGQLVGVGQLDVPMNSCGTWPDCSAGPTPTASPNGQKLLPAMNLVMRSISSRSLSRPPPASMRSRMSSSQPVPFAAGRALAAALLAIEAQRAPRHLDHRVAVVDDDDARRSQRANRPRPPLRSPAACRSGRR